MLSNTPAGAFAAADIDDSGTLSAAELTGSTHPQLLLAADIGGDGTGDATEYSV